MKTSDERLRVVAFTAAVGVVGLVIATLAHRAWPLASAPWFEVPILIALLGVAAHLLIRFRYREQVMALDLFESVLAGCIVLFAPLIVVGMTALALLGVELFHHRTEPRKIAFNVAQWTAASAVGSAVFHALGGGEPAEPRTAAALVAAMIAIAVVNLFAIAGVIRLTQHEPFFAVLRHLAPSLGLSWAVNTLFGLIFVATYSWTPAAMGLFFVALLVLHAAYRGYAAALADKARIESLHRATRTIANEIHPEDALLDFLEEVRACFGSEAAEIVLFDHEAGARTTYRKAVDSRGVIERAPARTGLAERIAGARTSVRIDDRSDPYLVEALHAEGWRDCVGAPLLAATDVLGVLCTFNRSGAEGFEDGEVTILGALAREATNAIVKGKLLNAIMGERQRFSDIVQTTSDGILTVARDGTILSWNPALEAITGYLATELIGTRLLDVVQASDEEGNVISIQAALDGDAEPPSRVQIRTRSGEVRWLSCSYSALGDGDKFAGPVIVIAREATKQYELDRLKDDFVATVSHELRTPLTPIKGWANTLIRAGNLLEPEEREDAARSILRQADALERLIVNLLEVAKLERGVIDLRERVIDVDTTVAKVVEEARAANPAREIVVERHHGATTAIGDEMWVERILWNLLSNALKYAPATEPITITLRRAPDAVRLSVIDRGPGIAPTDAEKIFERFQRLGDHMTRSTGGAGLGLYIARRLADAIGATLTLESTPGVGSEFTLKMRPATTLAAVV